VADATEGGAVKAGSDRPQLSQNLNRMKETFKEIKSSNDSIRQLAAVQNMSVELYVEQMKWMKKVAEEGVKKEKRRRERQYEDDEGSEEDDDNDDDEDNDDEDAMDEEDKRMQTQEDIPKKSKGKKKRRKATLAEKECLCWKQFTKTGCAQSKVGACKFVHFYDNGQSGFMASPVQVELLKERIREHKGTAWNMHLFKEYVPKMDVRGLL